MRLTAMDIRQQQFSMKLVRGFDPQEVDAFLEEVADDFDELIKENDLLKDQLATLEERMKEVEAREKMLHETLLTTQKMAEEFKESSKRAADIVLQEAQLQAQKHLEAAREEQGKLLADLEGLRRQRRQMADELLSTLGMYQRLVEQRLAKPDAS